MIVYIRNVSIFYFQFPLFHRFFFCFLGWRVVLCGWLLLFLVLASAQSHTQSHTHSSTTYNCIVAFMAAFSFSPLSTYVSVLKNKPQQFVVVVILWLWASPDIYFDLYELFRTGIKRSILADCYKHIIFDNCIHDYRRILTCIHFKQLVDGWGRKNARAHTHTQFYQLFTFFRAGFCGRRAITLRRKLFSLWSSRLCA